MNETRNRVSWQFKKEGKKKKKEKKRRRKNLVFQARNKWQQINQQQQQQQQQQQKFRFVAWRKGISPKICLLCVRVMIDKRSFAPFCVWIQFKINFVLRPVHQGMEWLELFNRFHQPFLFEKNLDSLHWMLSLGTRKGCESKHQNDQGHNNYSRLPCICWSLLNSHRKLLNLHQVKFIFGTWKNFANLVTFFFSSVVWTFQLFVMRTGKCSSFLCGVICSFKTAWPWMVECLAPPPPLSFSTTKMGKMLQTLSKHTEG